MRKMVLVGCALATGCSTVPSKPPACAAAGTNTFIGMMATSKTGAAILSATHSRQLRWAAPGAMLTMDFRRDRVTVRTGPDGKITAINCD